MEFYRLICKKAAILTNRLPQSSFMNEDLKVFAMFHFKLNILFQSAESHHTGYVQMSSSL